MSIDSSIRVSLEQESDYTFRVTFDDTALAPQRNADGRWRIGSAQVELLLAELAAGYQQLPRILEQFENFCIVTQSVRDGVDVQVTVRDGTGAIVHGGVAAGVQT